MIVFRMFEPRVTWNTIFLKMYKGDMLLCAVWLLKITGTAMMGSVVNANIVNINARACIRDATLFVLVARAVESPRSGAAATAAKRAASGCGEMWGGQGKGPHRGGERWAEGG